MLLYRTKTNDDLDWCVNHGIHNRAKNFLKVHFKGNQFLAIWSFLHRKQKIRVSVQGVKSLWGNHVVFPRLDARDT